MRILNKLVVFSLIVFSVSLCFMFYTYYKLTKGSAPEQIKPEGENTIHTVEAESNISSPAGEDSVHKEYVLKLKGDVICAYVSDGNKLKLWNSTKKPLSLSDEDVARLEKGLYTSSFEELCLFFESFAS